MKEQGIMTERQRAFVREVLEIGDVEGCVENFERRLLDLGRAAGLGRAIAAARPYWTILGPALGRLWSGDDHPNNRD